MLTALRLGYLLQLSVLELGEFSCVLKDFDETLLIERLLGCFCDGADGCRGSLEEVLFCLNISCIDGWQFLLLVVLGCGLALLDWCVLDRDGFAHLCLVNDD